MIQSDDKAYIANTYARFDIVIESGKGAVCVDANGKQYIDFSSGIGVNSLGFCNDRWIQAVSNQLMKVQHTSNLYYTTPCVQLAELLCKRTGFKKVFFANSGAEANEGAIKAARKYACDRYSALRNEIITLENSFHGRTITTLAATGQEVFHKNFAPFPKGFAYAKASDIEGIYSKISDKTAAIFIELIQGEGGVCPLEEDFIAAIAEICQKKDILLIVDEVQTGIGRTGKLFCYEHFGLRPDIVTSAKGLAGGLPIGAILFGEKTQDVLGYGDHGSTFGGNPISCAAGLEVLSQITPEMLDEVTAKGAYIKDRMMKLSNVSSVTGKGLMIGVALKQGTGRSVVEKCIQNGAILLTAKQKLRILPPLNITYQEIDKGLAIIERGIEDEASA